MNHTELPITWSDFTKVEMRIGTILEAEFFKEAQKPAYKMIIDFGSYGLRKTSAQITRLYTPEEVVGKQVVAVINFPAKQIANIMSECLLLGAMGEHHEITLLSVDKNVENGLRVG
ncbi:MAG: tRNA-binding protein [Cytophagales bacterium]|nr:tRNA-binding protein [Cytophaga sp.]